MIHLENLVRNSHVNSIQKQARFQAHPVTKAIVHMLQNPDQPHTHLVKLGKFIGRGMYGTVHEIESLDPNLDTSHHLVKLHYNPRPQYIATTENVNAVRPFYRMLDVDVPPWMNVEGTNATVLAKVPGESLAQITRGLTPEESLKLAATSFADLATGTQDPGIGNTVLAPNGISVVDPSYIPFSLLPQFTRLTYAFRKPKINRTFVTETLQDARNKLLAMSQHPEVDPEHRAWVEQQLAEPNIWESPTAKDLYLLLTET